MRKQRHNIYVSAQTWAYLNRDGQPSEIITKLVEDKMNKITARQIAESRAMWEERIDPDNNEPEAFDNLSINQKIALIIQMYPDDFDADGNPQ